MPKLVLVGFGLPASASWSQIRPCSSAQVGTFPISFSLPGKAVQEFVPFRKMARVPVEDISAIVAFLVIEEGPDCSAREILAARCCSSIEMFGLGW